MEINEGDSQERSADGGPWTSFQYEKFLDAWEALPSGDRIRAMGITIARSLPEDVAAACVATYEPAEVKDLARRLKEKT